MTTKTGSTRSIAWLWPFTVVTLACTSSRGDVFTSRASGVGSGGASVATGGARGDAAGASGSSAGGAGCAGAIYCTGFETPSELLTRTGSGTAELVSSPVHSGNSALRVSVAGVNDDARFSVPLAKLSQVGVRFWVMLDANAADFGASEVHVLAALHPAPELGVDGTNKVSIDLEKGYQLKLVETVTPDKKHSQSPLTPGDWHCLQLEVSGATGMEQATFDMDGTRRASTTTNPSVLVPGGLQALYIGIEYSSGPTPLVLYYDDVVVGETAAPCND